MARDWVNYWLERREDRQTDRRGIREWSPGLTPEDERRPARIRRETSAAAGLANVADREAGALAETEKYPEIHL